MISQIEQDNKESSCLFLTKYDKTILYLHMNNEYILKLSAPFKDWTIM